MTERDPFINPPLPYEYDALEPYIDAQTMHLHHDKHLQAYTDHLNDALRGHPELQRLSLEQLLLAAGRLPKAVGVPIQHNAGGVYNHRLYFDELRPDGVRRPVGALAGAIDRTYGSFDTFQKLFSAAALSVFGSGYAWLVSDSRGRLDIITTPNQETPLTRGLCPVLTADVWEHAYYLKHYNQRANYLNDWFQVVDWDGANNRYLSCRKTRRQ